MPEIVTSDIEVRLFIEAMLLRYGYDFRHYAQASFKRRVHGLARAAGCDRVGDLIPRILYDAGFLGKALAHLSVPVTEMFRDPQVFRTLRTEVLPRLGSYSKVKIWQAGCSTGEETYSLAIMLAEENLLHKTQIYATDINDLALAKAEEGIYPTRHLTDFAESYAKAGGKASLDHYFHSRYDFSVINQELRENVVFANHNLVTDGVFCEAQFILCRNVLIYFDRDLQQRVLALFADSLARRGFLCLGSRESLKFADAGHHFDSLNREQRIFRKKGTVP